MFRLKREWNHNLHQFFPGKNVVDGNKNIRCNGLFPNYDYIKNIELLLKKIYRKDLMVDMDG